MNNLLTTPFYKWNIHDWLYAQITDFKCFSGLALGKIFFNSLASEYKIRNMYKKIYDYTVLKYF